MRGVGEKVAVERKGGRVNYMHEDRQTFTCFSRAVPSLPYSSREIWSTELRRCQLPQSQAHFTRATGMFNFLTACCVGMAG